MFSNLFFNSDDDGGAYLLFDGKVFSRFWPGGGGQRGKYRELVEHGGGGRTRSLFKKFRKAI